LVAPGFVSGASLALDELQRLGAGFVAESLPLKVGGDGENLQPELFRQLHALPGVGFGAGVAGAAVQIEFPAGFFPAVEAGVLDEPEPLAHLHIAELAADQANLVVGSLAETVGASLLVTHARLSFPSKLGVLKPGVDADYSVVFGEGKRQGGKAR